MQNSNNPQQYIKKPFREKVKQEAREQLALKAQGLPIPASKKKYARLSGLITLLVTIPAFLLMLAIQIHQNIFYIGVLLLLLFFALVGFWQVISGQHVFAKMNEKNSSKR